MGCPEADCTKSLDNESLVFYSRGEASLFGKCFLFKKSTDGIINTESSRLSSSLYTTLTNEFACAATFSVNVAFTPHNLVRVLNPGHNLLVCAHIWTKTVYLWSNEALLDKLHGVLSCYAFKFSLGVLQWIDFDSSLCTTEWNVSNCKLESHETCQSFHLLQIDVVSVSCASFHRKLVG